MENSVGGERTVAIFAQTDVGKVRKNNEDSFLVFDTTSEYAQSLIEEKVVSISENSCILLVSDGMGGAAAGEVASLLTVNTVKEEMFSRGASHRSAFVDQVVDSLQQANNAILEETNQHPDIRGMGATATLAGIAGRTVFFAQVGDSRAYLVRNNAIKQVTKDQSFVEQLIEKGALTEEDAEQHPKRNLLLQAIGTHSSLQVAITSVDCCLNDYLILCSDGLSGFVKKEEIQSIVQSAGNTELICQELIDLANSRGGRDNITVIAAHLSGSGFPAPLQNGSIECKTISAFTPSFS